MANAYHSIVGVCSTSLVSVLTPGTTGQECLVKELRLSNTTGSTVTADVAILDGGVARYLIKGVSIPAGSSINVVDNVLVVSQADGHALQVKASASSSVDYVISYLNITP